MKEARLERWISLKSLSEALPSKKRTMLESVSCIITWPELFGSSTTYSVKSILTLINSSPTLGTPPSPPPFNPIFHYLYANARRGDVAYMIADISEVREDQIKDIYKKLSATPFNIVTRMLYWDGNFLHGIEKHFRVIAFNQDMEFCFRSDSCCFSSLCIEAQMTSATLLSNRIANSFQQRMSSSTVPLRRFVVVYETHYSSHVMRISSEPRWDWSSPIRIELWQCSHQGKRGRN